MCFFLRHEISPACFKVLVFNLLVSAMLLFLNPVNRVDMYSNVMGSDLKGIVTRGGQEDGECLYGGDQCLFIFKIFQNIFVKFPFPYRNTYLLASSVRRGNAHYCWAPSFLN